MPQANDSPDLFETLLRPLENAILDDGLIDSKLTLVKFYTAFIHHWTVSLAINPEISSNAELSIPSLVEHASNLALSTLQTSHTISTISTVITFFEATASLARRESKGSSPRIIPPPPPEAIYMLSFTPSLSNLSRVCKILADFKRVLEVPNSSNWENIAVPCEYQISARQHVNNFNGYLIDICNCLWRSRAFNSVDSNSVGCLLSPIVTESLSIYVAGIQNTYSLSSLYDLSLSPLTCLLASTYFKNQEDRMANLRARHDGPVTRTSLKYLYRDGGLEISWQDYKLGVLKHLQERGAPGISELIHSTLKHLISTQEV